MRTYDRWVTRCDLDGECPGCGEPTRERGDWCGECRCALCPCEAVEAIGAAGIAVCTTRACRVAAVMTGTALVALAARWKARGGDPSPAHRREVARLVDAPWEDAAEVSAASWG